MTVTVHHGDSREVLKSFADASIDSVVCDPPYALVSVVQRFGNSPRSEATENTANPYGRTGRGFMGQRWDTGETAFDPAFWIEVLRVLKPGGHLIAFSGTRTYHRLACAVEDAGFEIRDMISWLYGSGFPKSHNVGKKTGRAEDDGLGTALKPACEPIVLARKPMAGTVAANVLALGTGALNIDGCRIDGGAGGERAGESSAGRRYADQGSTNFAPTPGPRGGDARGRWPANVIHDGSAEVVDAFPDTVSGTGAVKRASAEGYQGNALGKESRPVGTTMISHGDAGSAARFFYSAKADAADRCGSKHPTVKPIDLMAYLCRLVTPKGGVVLDPFAGSGSTGMACLREGFDCVLIEREAEYVADIHRRLQHVEGSDTPLFAQAVVEVAA
ncbi:DNA methyltransferase [Brevundimonas sp.]|uniref:DNA-methyltransferase n=1 Tax=Brevundimonas sp. TaxID=1871086 RepID=UPI0028AE9949|nr:DNA methyltransferase [Brevundimonas sp.]